MVSSLLERLFDEQVIINNRFLSFLFINLKLKDMYAGVEIMYLRYLLLSLRKSQTPVIGVQFYPSDVQIIHFLNTLIKDRYY